MPAGEIMMLTEALAEFDGKQWSLFFVLLLTPIAAGLGAAKFLPGT